MNAGAVKKLKKLSKVAWFEYVREIKKWSFIVRLRFCWYILFAKPKGIYK